MKPSLSKSLRQLAFVILILNFGGCGACSVFLAISSITAKTSQKLELNADTTVDELLAKCGRFKIKKKEYIEWTRPRCVRAKDLGVYFNPKTRKITKWSERIGSERVETLIPKNERIVINHNTTIDELFEACGQPSYEAEKIDSLAWTNLECIPLKTLAVLFNPETRKIVRMKEERPDGKIELVLFPKNEAYSATHK